jgi:hypothetical protein
VRALRSFAGLGNSTNLAVVDARLRLRELFDALAASPRADPPASGCLTVTAERSRGFAVERPGVREKSQSATGSERDGTFRQRCRREAENLTDAPPGGCLH